jgi:putative MFS transporter
MGTIKSTLSDRQAVWAFVAGCIAVTLGVCAHFPMFMMARSMHYRLAGMAMDNSMLAGMGLIILGTLVAAYGLLPRNVAAQRATAAQIVVAAPEDAHLGLAHWGLMAVLTVALVIDVMKPASLGFTVPGMISEYGVPKKTVSLVPFLRWPAR